MNILSLALLWIVSEIATPKRVNILLHVIIGASVLVCLEGVAQWLGHGILIPWQNTGAPIATIGNTNYVGAYLIFPIFACLAVRKWYVIPPLALCLFILILSRARASWLGIAIGGFVWAWMTLPKQWFRVTVAGALIAGAVGWSVIPERSLGGFRDGKTLGYRLKYWQAAIELWKDSPLIGIGFDGYRQRVYEAQAKIAERNPGWFTGYVDPKPRRVHNEYLQALVDGGLLYAVTLFAFIGWVLVNSYKAARGDPFIRGIWCAQVSILVCAFFFFTFRLVDTTSLFHIYLGVLCATFTSSSLQVLSTAKA